jgi:hypothetical protein
MLSGILTKVVALRGRKIVIKPRLWYLDDFLRLPRGQRSLRHVQFSCWKKNDDGTYSFAMYRLDRVEFYVRV